MHAYTPLYRSSYTGPLLDLPGYQLPRSASDTTATVPGPMLHPCSATAAQSPTMPCSGAPKSDPAGCPSPKEQAANQVNTPKPAPDAAATPPSAAAPPTVPYDAALHQPASGPASMQLPGLPLVKLEEHDSSPPDGVILPHVPKAVEADGDENDAEASSTGTTESEHPEDSAGGTPEVSGPGSGAAHPAEPPLGSTQQQAETSSSRQLGGAAAPLCNFPLHAMKQTSKCAGSHCTKRRARKRTVNAHLADADTKFVSNTNQRAPYMCPGLCSTWRGNILAFCSAACALGHKEAVRHSGSEEEWLGRAQQLVGEWRKALQQRQQPGPANDARERSAAAAAAATTEATVEATTATATAGGNAAAAAAAAATVSEAGSAGADTKRRRVSFGGRQECAVAASSLQQQQQQQEQQQPAEVPVQSDHYRQGSMDVQVDPPPLLAVREGGHTRTLSADRDAADMPLQQQLLGSLKSEVQARTRAEMELERLHAELVAVQSQHSQQEEQYRVQVAGLQDQVKHLQGREQQLQQQLQQLAATAAAAAAATEEHKAVKERVQQLQQQLRVSATSAAESAAQQDQLRTEVKELREEALQLHAARDLMQEKVDAAEGRLALQIRLTGSQEAEGAAAAAAAGGGVMPLPWLAALVPAAAWGAEPALQAQLQQLQDQNQVLLRLLAAAREDCKSSC